MLLDIRRTEKTAAGYCYGSRMAYIDKETWQPIWMDLYDVDLKLWKTGPSMYKPMALPNTGGDVATGGGGPGDGMYEFYDMQNNHLTFDIQPDALINENVACPVSGFQPLGHSGRHAAGNAMRTRAARLSLVALVAPGTAAAR